MYIIPIEYERQFNVGTFFCDVFVPEKNLILEADGCYWHGCETCGFSKPKAKARDKSRDAYIRGQGFEIVRLLEHDVKVNPMAAVGAIFAQVAA